MGVTQKGEPTQPGRPSFVDYGVRDVCGASHAATNVTSVITTVCTVASSTGRCRTSARPMLASAAASVATVTLTSGIAASYVVQRAEHVAHCRLDGRLEGDRVSLAGGE